MDSRRNSGDEATAEDAWGEAPVFRSAPTEFTKPDRAEEELERHGLHIPGRRIHKITFHGKRPEPRSHHLKRKKRSVRPDYLRPKIERFSADVHLVLSVCDPSTHEWRTAPVTFDQFKNDDREVWWEIRRAYRQDLQKSWRRWLFFRKLKYIVPIEYSHNGVPTRHKPADYLDARMLMHAYHHPGRIRRDKLWIGWLVHLKNSGDPGKSYGLEFVEGLWVEKLVHAGSFGSALMLIPTILWPLRGGELGIVFTVLSFVQSWISVILALIAIYYTAIISEL